MFAVVKNVRSWRSVCKEMCGGMGYSSRELTNIQQQYDSDEDRLKAVVERFLKGVSQFQQPSWRAVIWSLYKANEFQLAEQIRSYAEPVQGTVI